jgi:hypothetical protein
MPHEPLTGDALLDALAEVPGDPAEPVPAPYHGKSLWGWTPNADIPHVVSVPIEAALADLRARLPDDPWSAQYQGTVFDPPAIEPEPSGRLMVSLPADIAEQAVSNLLDHLKREADSPVRMVRMICPELRDRVPTQIVQNPYKQPDLPPASEALIESPRVITWEPVPLAITDWRVFINPTEEENPE